MLKQNHCKSRYQEHRSADIGSAFKNHGLAREKPLLPPVVLTVGMARERQLEDRVE